MLTVERFVVNMIEENCYLLWDDSREVVIIDCGAFYDEEKAALKEYIEKHGLTVKRLLNTHGHFDHVFGNRFVTDTYGIAPELSAEDVELYRHAEEQLRMFLHRDFSFTVPQPSAHLKAGDTITVGNHCLQAIACPGHTPGGLCFYEATERLLFSGDSLFRGSVGRCDLPGGNEALLLESLRTNILTLPADVKVLPGHGPQTTVGEEARHNPYLA